MAKRTINLGEVKIASPCPADWAAMTGDDRSRHCGQCDRDVYNLSSMTQDEAEEFIASTIGADRTCVRFYVRADGKVMTADCGVAVKRRRKRLAFLGAGVAALFTLIAGVAIGKKREQCATPNGGGTTLSTLTEYQPFTLLADLFPSLFPVTPPQPPVVMGRMAVTPQHTIQAQQQHQVPKTVNP